MDDYRARNEERRRRLLRGTRWLFLGSVAALIASFAGCVDQYASEARARTDPPNSDDRAANFGLIILLPALGMSLVATVTTGFLYWSQARALRPGLAAPGAPEGPGSA